MDAGDVVLDDLRTFCAALTTCLKTTERKLETETQLDYRIVGLRHASYGMTISPSANQLDTDDGAEVLGLFDQTIRAIEQGKRIDPRFDSHDLQDFRRLVQPLGGKVRSIRFGRFAITDKFRVNIDKMLSEPAVAEGEATGVLERIDVHGKNAFTLFPNLGGPIICQFEASLFERVRQAIKRNVTISGRMLYYLGSAFPSKAKVRSIEVHPDDDDLPSLMDLRGSLVGNGDSRTAVEIVRAARDG